MDDINELKKQADGFWQRAKQKEEASNLYAEAGRCRAPEDPKRAELLEKAAKLKLESIKHFEKADELYKRIPSTPQLKKVGGQLE